MKKKPIESIFLIFLSLIFTAGLLFASFEAPRALDKMLRDKIDFLDVATGQNQLTAYKTELFLSHYHIRLIGYICLALILILIILGFVLEKRGITSTGAILLFLPVFGHFAATMFFLGGLAFLRFLWLPFLDVSFELMRLGDVLMWPYRWILNSLSAVGIDAYKTLPFIVTGLGIFLFLMGTFSWMIGKIKGKNVTDFWIYRISRHPQYLGWIIWSYGILFLPGVNMKRYIDVPNSLPWLLSTMIIIGVALLEERKMIAQFGEDYNHYQKLVPFLLPVPLFVKRIFSYPLRLLFKVPYPEKRREIVSILALYTAIFIVISAWSTGLVGDRQRPIVAKPRIGSLTATIRSGRHRGEMRKAAASLSFMGNEAVDSLIILLDHPNDLVRWYCVDALGNVRSDKIVQPAAKLLKDPNRTVRKMAAGALGNSGSSKAVQILIDVYLDAATGVQTDAARALGKLRAEVAVPDLSKGLKSEDQNIVRWSAWALGEIGSENAIDPLIRCMDKNGDTHHFKVGEALQKLNSPKALDAYIAGLEKGEWWIQQSCAEALGHLGMDAGITPLMKTMDFEDARVRRASVLALSKFPISKVDSFLTKALKDEDWEVRMYAEVALKSE